jgi:hypothetical protein
MLILKRGDFSPGEKAISLTAVRDALESGLVTLGDVGRLSLMSRRGRRALQRFLQVFDSLSTTISYDIGAVLQADNY